MIFIFKRNLEVLFIVSLLSLSNLLFAQSSNPGLIKNAELEVNFKNGATAFYLINPVTGQLSFMNTTGDNAGAWQQYGNPYRTKGTSRLFFKAIEEEFGTAFYILNGKNGQISVMKDYGGPDAGTWIGYGNPLRNARVTEFEANMVDEGVIFYAYDGVTKQLYFMQDFGEKSGNWIPYGYH